MHAKLIDDFGGTPGVLNENLLHSALAAPYQSFDGKLLFPTIEEQAVRLCYGLIKNHPFVDGNKRIGIMALLVTARLNSLTINANNEDLIMLGFGIAKKSIDYQAALAWVKQHQK